MTAAARPARRAGTGRIARTAPARSAAAPAGTARKGRVQARPVRAIVPVVAGAAWAVVLLAALGVSSLLTVVVMAPVAALAAATALRATESKRRRRSSCPSTLQLVALALCVLDPLIALGGMAVGVVALVLSAAALSALVARSVVRASARPARTAALRLVAAFSPALAVTSVVLARHQGSSLALIMVGAAMAFDVGAFLMGSGRTPLGGPVGVAFGAASVAVVALFAAAVMDPPMSGLRPWVSFAVVALAAPLGVRLCQWSTGGERLPALRRLDSLSLVAPAWILVATFVLHR